MSRQRWYYNSILILFLICSGCSWWSEIPSTNQNLLYVIDPVFQKYYNQLGGIGILGDVISPLISEGQFQFQYTTNSLLMNNLTASVNSGFSLAPLGKEMNLSCLSPSNESIEIFAPFISTVDLLGGIRVVGKPLTPMRYNPLKKRHEQFFENLGFYQLSSDLLEEVHLLAYGAWKCGDACMLLPVNASEVVLPERIDTRFEGKICQIGIDFSGFALTSIIDVGNGKTIQVFDNIILQQDSHNSGLITLMPLPEQMGIFPEPLVTQNPEITGSFFPVSGEKGYNIPGQIKTEIEQHGGVDVSGLPITEFARIDENVSRQCFKNLCLEEDIRLSGIYRVYPSSLGFEFAVIKYPGDIKNRTSEHSTENNTQEEIPTLQTNPAVEYSLEIWETYPWVSQTQSQEIGVRVFANQQSLSGITPYLVLFSPQGEQVTLMMPPTSTDGESIVSVNSIDAPNGTMIGYMVCIQTQNGESYCARGDFPIWDTK